MLSAFIARFKRRGAIAAQPSGDYTSPAGSCKGLPAPEKDGGVGPAKPRRCRARDVGRAGERDGAAGGGGGGVWRSIEEDKRERVPLEWAATQMNLGNALKVLGERESGRHG